MKKSKLSLDEKKANMGYLFILPWLLGFIFLFAIPLIQSVVFSLNKIVLTSTGYELEYVGLRNYKNALLVHPTFVRVLTESMQTMASFVPLVVLFSLFAATLLNQKFKGRTTVRAIFFLPVILGSGVIFMMQNYSWFDEFSRGADSVGISAELTMRGFSLRRYLEEIASGLNISVIKYVVNAVRSIYAIIHASGVQILIFLAGLQSIPPSIYEACHIEGATSWEVFWKVTFPMISPLILANAVYTIIDTFTISYNDVMLLIRTTALGGNPDLSSSAAMALIYFAAIAVVLAIVIGFISRKVFYQET